MFRIKPSRKKLAEQCSIPEDLNPSQHHCEKLKSPVALLSLLDGAKFYPWAKEMFYLF